MLSRSNIVKGLAHCDVLGSSIINLVISCVALSSFQYCWKIETEGYVRHSVNDALTCSLSIFFSRLSIGYDNLVHKFTYSFLERSMILHEPTHQICNSTQFR